MIVYESLKDNRDLLIRLARAGIAIEDVKHLELYEDFVRLRADGLKTTYVVVHLCDQYEVSEATVWRIIRKFQRVLVQ